MSASFAVVRIDEIELSNKSTQPRVTMDEEAIERYKDMWLNAEDNQCPFSEDILLIWDDAEAKYWIASGWHRIFGAVRANRDTIPAKIEYGNEEKAKILAAGQNHTHGVPASNEDKRRAVRMVLEVSPTLPSNRIAKHCHVSTFLVDTIRSGGGSESESVSRISGGIKDKVAKEEPEVGDKPAKKKPGRPPRERMSAPSSERSVIRSPEVDAIPIPTAEIATLDRAIEANFRALSNYVDRRQEATNRFGRNKEFHDNIIRLLTDAFENFLAWKGD